MRGWLIILHYFSSLGALKFLINNQVFTRYGRFALTSDQSPLYLDQCVIFLYASSLSHVIYPYHTLGCGYATHRVSSLLHYPGAAEGLYAA